MATQVRVPTVAGFGDSIIDVFPGTRHEHLGGNCINVAVFAKRRGADSAYVGVVGDDQRGRRIVDSLAAEGIDVRFVRRVNGETGWVRVDVLDGDRTFVTGNRGGVTRSNPYRLDEAARRYLAAFDLVHSSVYSASEAELPMLDRSTSVVTYDFSSEAEFRADDYLRWVCPHVDVAQFSCPGLDGQAVAAVMRAAVRAGASAAVATRGPLGAMALFGGHVVAVPAEFVPPLEILDTTGCGDAFFATFAIELLKLGNPRTRVPGPGEVVRCLQAAARDAAAQCRVSGALGHAWPILSGGHSESHPDIR